MNILTDILSLFKRKKFAKIAKPTDVIVIGINEEPDIEGIASPVPYKDVKLITVQDFVDGQECENRNVPLDEPEAGVFKDKTFDTIGGACFDNFRRLRSVGINLSIQENGDYIDFDCTAEANTASNIGGGAEIFKEKVGEDFVFKTLTSSDGTVTFDVSDPNVVDLSAPGADFGIWSTVDANGDATYYDFYADAAAAASAGDTITLHADYELSTGSGQTLKNGVNINLNGFTYTYSNTDTSSAFSDVLAGGSTSMKIYNGTVIRTGQSAMGAYNDTLALEITQGGAIECFGVKFINEDGWAIYLDNGFLLGGYGEGTQGGISLGGTYELRDSIGYGIEAPGISTEGNPKITRVVNCRGESLNAKGMYLLTTTAIDCTGIHYGNAEKEGIHLETCISQGIQGYSKTGTGVLVQFGQILGCEGRTSSNFVSAGDRHSGVILKNTYIAQNVNGYTDGDTDSRGITVIANGAGIYQNFLNCSSAANNSLSTSLEIIANNDEDSFDNILVFKNCSATSFNKACDLDSSNTGDADNYITMLNCSFSTDDDSGICIEGINTSKDLAYANCAFRTGKNSLGTPLVNIIQTMTNTPDPQGNIYA